jgi:hypothetical protein
MEAEKKIHKKLKLRLIFLGGVTTVIAGMLAYDLLFQGLRFIPVIGFASFGFILGFFVFTRMNKIAWDEEKEAINIGKFDMVSFILVALYVAYRISIEYFLKSHYHNAISISGFSLATLFGGMVGRLIGMVWTIERTHREQMLIALQEEKNS